MSSLGFVFTVLQLSAYCIRCIFLPFPAISRRFFIRTGDSDDILESCGYLQWIMYVMISPMVSMHSSSYRVSSRFLNSSWNYIFFYPIRVA